MKSRILKVFLLALSFNISVKAHADVTLNDVFADIFFENVYQTYSSWEIDFLETRLGLQVESCDIQNRDRKNPEKIETHTRPGILLCVFEHLLHQMTHPQRAVDITAWVKFLNKPNSPVVPFRVVLKVKPLPDTELVDYLSQGVSYLVKLKTNAMRWKDATIILESKVGPLAVADFFPEGDDNNLLASQALLGETVEVSKLVFKIKTALKNEPIEHPCTTIPNLSAQQSRICVQLALYGENHNRPTMTAIAESNWTARPQNQPRPPSFLTSFVRLLTNPSYGLMAFAAESQLRRQIKSDIREIQLSMEINPDARIDDSHLLTRGLR